MSGRESMIEVIRRHERVVKDTGSKVELWCPFHDDGAGKPPHTPNCRVDVEKRCWYCDVCCRGGGLRELAEALGLDTSAYKANGDGFEATFGYTDVHGNLAFQVVRLPGKQFRARRPKPGGGWFWGMQGVQRVLYRLHEVIGRPDETVFVVEGEKDADRLAREGLVATTNPFGAGKWQPCYGDLLRGRECVILGDNDDAGRRHVREVAADLVGKAASVRVVDLPDQPEKADVSSWLGAGRRVEDLFDLVARAPELEIGNHGEPGDSDEAARPSDPMNFVPFPTDALPDAVARYVVEAAAAIGVDPSLIGLAVLVMLGGAIGTSRSIKIKRSWREFPIMWGSLVAPSGTKKTPAIKTVLRSLYRLQDRALKEYQDERAEFEKAKAIYDADFGRWKRSKAADRGDPPKCPVTPEPTRYFVSDVTTEVLGPLLKSNPRGLTVVVDELSGWLDFDRYTGGHGGGDAARWLSAWSGTRMTQDRIGRSSVHVPQAALSLIGGIQPGTLRRCLGRQHQEDGLMARLLFAAPPGRPPTWTEDDLDEEAEDRLGRIVESLIALEPTRDPDDNLAPVSLSFEPAARQRFIQWTLRHAADVEAESGDLRASLAKMEAYCARLSLILELADAAASGQEAHFVRLRSVEGAIRLVEFFSNEARRVLGMLEESDERRKLRERWEWIVAKGGRISPRGLVAGKREFRDDPDGARKALEDLAQAGFGRLMDGHGPGRPTTWFVAHGVGVSETPEESA